MEIGTSSNYAKVAQMVSQVRGEKPDWLSFATVTRTANSVIDGVAAKVKIPPVYRDWETDRKSTRLNSSHITRSRMPSSA